MIKRLTQLISCAFQCKHLFDTLFASIFCSCADFALFCCYFRQIFIQFGANLASKFKKKNMHKQHLLMVLIGINLVRNISIKKASYFMPD